MMAAIGKSYGRMIARSSSQRAPKYQPPSASSAHQINDPINDSAVKRQNLTRVTPAGNEMNVRTIGSRRDRNAVQSPHRANHLSARSRSSMLIMMYLPYRSTSGRPP